VPPALFPTGAVQHQGAGLPKLPSFLVLVTAGKMTATSNWRRFTLALIVPLLVNVAAVDEARTLDGFVVSKAACGRSTLPVYWPLLLAKTSEPVAGQYGGVRRVEIRTICRRFASVMVRCW